MGDDGHGRIFDPPQECFYSQLSDFPVEAFKVDGPGGYGGATIGISTTAQTGSQSCQVDFRRRDGVGRRTSVLPGDMRNVPAVTEADHEESQRKAGSTIPPTVLHRNVIYICIKLSNTSIIY